MRLSVSCSFANPSTDWVVRVIWLRRARNRRSCVNSGKSPHRAQSTRRGYQGSGNRNRRLKCAWQRCQTYLYSTVVVLKASLTYKHFQFLP